MRSEQEGTEMFRPRRRKEQTTNVEVNQSAKIAREHAKECAEELASRYAEKIKSLEDKKMAKMRSHLELALKKLDVPMSSPEEIEEIKRASFAKELIFECMKAVDQIALNITESIKLEPVEISPYNYMLDARLSSIGEDPTAILARAKELMSNDGPIGEYLSKFLTLAVYRGYLDSDRILSNKYVLAVRLFDD